MKRGIALLAAVPLPALAHHAGAAGMIGVEPWAAACLAASAVLYAIGLGRLWRRAGMGRGISAADVARFTLGWLLLCAALLSPLDAWAERSFAAHMVQHELLMAAAAPLLVLGRPLEAWTWALAPPWRIALAGAARAPALRALWGSMTSAVGAWTLHAVALWTWHIPALFEAALASEALHIAQHACFLGTALFFWWSVFDRGRRDSGAAALASLFTTMGHTGALGALLTFAAHPWYAAYAKGGAFGLGALEDQQLGGLIMWAPASLAYLVAALVIASRWLLPPRRRTAGSFAASSRSSC
jgi:putative membrane protein